MKLFIDLYTDEDVDVLVAELLRGRGFGVITTRDHSSSAKVMPPNSRMLLPRSAPL